MKNVLLVTIDSLRADHLSCLKNSRKTTPNLDKLAREGVLFKNAISCGPDTPTSIVPLLTSNYVLTYILKSDGSNEPRNRGEDFEWVGEITSKIYREKTTIVDALKKQDYATAAFHSNPFLSRHFNFGKGFDYFYDSLSSRQQYRKYVIKDKFEKLLKKNLRLYNFAKYFFNRVKSTNIPYERAEIINKRVISWVKEQDKQFFVWVHYMDVHFPYKPPKEFQSIFGSKSMNNAEMTGLNYKMIHRPQEISEDEIEDLIDLYDGAIRYADYSIKMLLDELNKINALNDTIVIITADHGDEFRDHGDFAHHHAKLYDELSRVPLIISNIKNRNIEIDSPVSLLDVTPTILDLLGIPEEISFQGKSLVHTILGEKRSQGVIGESFQKGRRNISYRTEDWKYILNETDDKVELYNLKNDPEEKINLSEKEKQKVREFQLKIEEHIRTQEKIIKSNIKEKEKIRKKIKNLKVTERI